MKTERKLNLPVKEKVFSKKVTNKFRCNKCEFTFNSRRKWEEHMQKAHKVNLIKGVETGSHKNLKFTLGEPTVILKISDDMEMVEKFCVPVYNTVEEANNSMSNTKIMYIK